MSELLGGFRTIQLPFPLGSGQDNHVFVPSPDALRAVNQIQAVPYRINPFVWSVLSTALAAGDRVGGLAPADPEPLPEVPSAVYQAMPAAAQQAHKLARKLVHDRNAQHVRARWRVSQAAAVARRFEREDRIYFAAACDWRARIYTVGDGLNPQGDGLQKGLLRFATAEPLTADAAAWLEVGIANAAGQDKLPLEARREWVRQHLELLRDSVQDPLDGDRFWTAPGVDSPWELLALAHDYVHGVSTAPVRLDCSCNGLQHLAALSGDANVARSVNLLGGDRQDIYGEVAQAVAEDVSARALAGDPLALKWAGKVSRKTLKPACMKLAYGQGTISRRDDLTEFATEAVGDRGAFAAARWLTYRIEGALESKVHGPMLVMQYLATMGKALARAKQPVEWVTPSGSKVVQKYAVSSTFEVETLAGRIAYKLPGQAEKRPDTRAAGRSLAPNLVHSFDAAHLTAAVLAFGGRPVTVVHDSAGCHAGDVGELAQIMRDTFAEVYAVDRLAEFDEQQRSRCPELVQDMPMLPPRGPLNVQAVRQSTYFFS